MFGDFPMKFADNEVNLGDTIASQVLEMSVALTIEKKVQQDKRSHVRSKVSYGRLQNASGGRYGRCLGLVGASKAPLPACKL